MKVLVASSIDPDALDCLAADHDVRRAFNASDDALSSAIADREVVVFRSGVHISADVMRSASELKLLVRAGSGLDNVDVPYARNQGLRLVRIPGSSAQPVAEFTFGLMLTLARRVALADRLLRQGHWPKAQLAGPLLHGKTLGIVGTGKIGSRVGELGVALGMHPIGCVARAAAGVGDALRRRGIAHADFATVVAEADFLCLHVPLDASTHHMINAEVLSQMKRQSFLINVARGGVVDEEALYHELTEGSNLGGAALDVHEREGEGTLSLFSELSNVVLTPHIGAMALDAQREIGLRVVEIVNAFAESRLEDVAVDGELVL
jgi:D-3-phosphoglycerate dehydrogenase / 2-oxoglutarate reductase